MKQKKVYKLKTWPKVLLIILVILGVASYIGYQKYQEYLYTQTSEYALYQLGYKEDEVKLFQNKLSDSEIDKILTYEYNEFIYHFVNCKYFMFKNLDEYLGQVITQDEDFFKYHGTEGYDYDFIVAQVNVHTVHTQYSVTFKTDKDKNYGMLVNKYFELGGEYEPDDLVAIDWKYRLGDAGDIKKARKEVVDAYLRMWEAAHEEGIYLLVDSAYRSYDSQVEVYNHYEEYKGTTYADGIAARPGFSEHQTGLSLDIYSKECTSAKTFKDSKTYEWLINNSYKYGFILRYPDGKKNLTGYNYESWHYRYLGTELATKVHDSNLTYDEYYAFYMDK